MNIKEYAKKPEIISGALAVALYAAAGIVLFVNLGNLPPKDLIIRFNAAEGIKTLGGKIDALMIFIISGLILAGNLLLARELFYKSRVLAIALIWTSGLIALFTLITMGLIVSIN